MEEMVGGTTRARLRMKLARASCPALLNTDSVELAGRHAIMPTRTIFVKLEWRTARSSSFYFIRLIIFTSGN